MKTPASLLERLRQAPAVCSEDWNRLVELYTPLLSSFARRMGLQEADVADLVQEVFLKLLSELPRFSYDRNGSFRGWLRTVTLRTWWAKNRRRPPTPLPLDDDALQALAGPDAIKAFEEHDFHEYVVQRLLPLIRPAFTDSTWKAFENRDRPAAEVARELGISAAAVHMARYRILRRLRDELDGMLG